MKNLLINIGRFLLSGVIAFIVLTFFCYFYYNIPAHEEALDGVTDYKWESNVFYSRGTEGFAWGRTNNEGYINLMNYYDGMNINTLIMGSSQMEAYQVKLNQSTSSVLNSMLGNENVYNIGISSHTFLTCINNLENAIMKYKPTNYVVIETSNIKFDDDSLLNLLNETYPKIPSKYGKIVSLLQKNQYLRLVYKQLKEYGEQGNSNTELKIVDNIQVKNELPYNEDLLSQVFQKVNNILQNYDVKLIILYHPSISLDNEGKIVFSTDNNELNVFKKLCDENNIIFLDMSNRFRKEYVDNYILPYGFSNTTIGSGHLNKYGHKMIAEELYKIIKEEK